LCRKRHKNQLPCQRDIGDARPLFPDVEQAQVGQLGVGQARLEIAGDRKDDFDTRLAQVGSEIIGIAKGECSTIRHLLAPC